MSSNLSILEKNLIDSFETVEAQEEFMWAAHRKDADLYLYNAEKYAREVDQVMTFILPHLNSAATLHKLETIPDGLIDFIVKRLRHKNFG